MSAVEHKANAEKLIDDVDQILDEPGRDHFDDRQGALALIEATRANALASLHLAEQQRIANLIALAALEMNGPMRHLAVEPDGEYHVQPTAEIREGLGIS